MTARTLARIIGRPPLPPPRERRGGVRQRLAAGGEQIASQEEAGRAEAVGDLVGAGARFEPDVLKDAESASRA